jgi:hypothetical protein
VVGDKGVGGTAVGGRIAIGLWVAKGSDTTSLEGGLEVESVLKGLNLTKPCIFAGGNSRSATVINLSRSSVSRRRMIPERARTS